MKTKNLWLAAIAIFAGMSLAACSDDDKDDPKVDSKVLTLTSSLDVDFDDDLLNLCDVSITYFGFDGGTRTEKITAGNWANNMYATTFPVTQKYEITVTPKSNPTLTKATYDCDFEVEFEAYTVLNNKRTMVVPERDDYICTRENVPASEVMTVVNEIAQKVNDYNYNYTFTQNEDGNVVARLNEK